MTRFHVSADDLTNRFDKNSMFLLVWAAIASESENNDSKHRTNKYSITRITPNEINSDANEFVHIEVSPEPVGVPFCKFGDIVVAGLHGTDNVIKCRAPQLASGVVNVSVSFDKLKWSNSVPITVLSNTSLTTWIVLGIFGVGFLGVAFRMRKVFCGGRRKRRVVKRRARRTAPEKPKTEGIVVHNRRGNVEL